MNNLNRPQRIAFIAAIAPLLLLAVAAFVAFLIIGNIIKGLLAAYRECRYALTSAWEGVSEYVIVGWALPATKAPSDEVQP